MSTRPNELTHALSARDLKPSVLLCQPILESLSSACQEACLQPASPAVPCWKVYFPMRSAAQGGQSASGLTPVTLRKLRECSLPVQQRSSAASCCQEPQKVTMVHACRTFSSCMLLTCSWLRPAQATRTAHSRVPESAACQCSSASSAAIKPLHSLGPEACQVAMGP